MPVGDEGNRIPSDSVVQRHQSLQSILTKTHITKLSVSNYIEISIAQTDT